MSKWFPGIMGFVRKPFSFATQSELRLGEPLRTLFISFLEKYLEAQRHPVVFNIYVLQYRPPLWAKHLEMKTSGALYRQTEAR